MVASGVSHFPQPLEFSENLVEISLCQSCVLCKTRLKVVHEEIAIRKYMAIAEFPQENDEVAFFESEPSQLLMRLLQKLEVAEATFRSFAIKCLPKSVLPNDSLLSCAKNVAYEIEHTHAEVLFCFGPRAIRTLEYISGEVFEKVPEVGEVAHVSLFGKMRTIFAFPTLKELVDHPEWRQSVWQSLLPFKGKI